MRPLSSDGYRPGINYPMGVIAKSEDVEADWAAGIPREQFAGVADGLLNTVNQTESDYNKKIIDKKLKEKGISYRIRYQYNYYMDC